jgi:hypothetical protein
VNPSKPVYLTRLGQQLEVNVLQTDKRPASGRTMALRTWGSPHPEVMCRVFDA